VTAADAHAAQLADSKKVTVEAVGTVVKAGGEFITSIAGLFGSMVTLASAHVVGGHTTPK
jgi:hypothetical protein